MCWLQMDTHIHLVVKIWKENTEIGLLVDWGQAYIVFIDGGMESCELDEDNVFII